MRASPVAPSSWSSSAKHPARRARLHERRCFAAGSTGAARVAASASRRTVLLGTTAVALQGGGILPGALPATGAASFTERQAIGDGVSLSRVTKGCWQISGGHRGDTATDRTSGQAALDDFTAFYQAGITSFDMADHYGPAEQLVGQWIRQRSDAEGRDVRKDVQVLTKVCVFDNVGMAMVRPGSIKQAVETSVKRLGTAPDVQQFYWGDLNIPRYVDAAKYLADEQAKGQFKLLGVTNFDVSSLEKITKAGVRLHINQVQYSLLDRRPDNGMIEFSAANGMQLLPYGVLAGGLISDRYLGKPASSVQFDTFSKRKYARVLQEAGGWAWFQELLRELRAVADKHDSTISNVATRWVLSRPQVAAVTIGARNALHLGDHVALQSVRLDEDDLARIQDVLKRGHQNRGDCYEWERGTGEF